MYQLAYWLKHRGYNEKLVTQQILKAREFTRKDLLNQDSQSKWRNKLVLNFSYYPAHSKLNNILSFSNLLVTPET